MSFFDFGVNNIRLIIGDVCNLQCGYCSVCDAEKGRNNMPDALSEDMKQYLIWLNQHAGRSINICFFGGEPLIFFDRIKEIYSFFESMKNRIYTFSFVTNGKLMDREKLNWFNERFFRISYSYDGPKSEEIRGYDVWKEKRDIILDTENASLSGVLTSKSYIFDVCTSMQEIQKEYKKRNGHDIGVTMTDVMENLDGHRDKTLADVDIEKMKSQYRDLFSYYLKYVRITDQEQKNNFYEQYTVPIRRARGIIEGKILNYSGRSYGLTHFCNEFFGDLSVDLNGNIYDCPFGSRPFMHIADKSEHILRSLMENEYPLMKRKDGMCRSCFAWPLCYGGCKNNTDPEALRKWCRVQKAIMEVVMEIAENVKTKVNIA